MNKLPIAAEAFADGRIGAEHVERIAAARIPERVDAPADAEEMLVGNAERLSHKDFVKTVAFFEEVTARDDAHPNPGEEKRRCHSTRTWDGTGKVDAVLDPVGWSSFDECLRRIEQELFDADWAACVGEHGKDASADKLTRTPSQRRADALVEMAHRAATAPKDGKRPEPLVILHTDAETFTEHVKAEGGAPADPPADGTCELQDGTVVHPRVAIAAAIEGHVRRLVWQSPGVVLDYGRKQRLFAGVLRQLLQVRDRTCDGPGCDIDARRCEGDHLQGWTDGGRTDHINGRCRCTWHHRHKHQFEITLDPVTGRTRWTPRRQ